MKEFREKVRKILALAKEVVPQDYDDSLRKEGMLAGINFVLEFACGEEEEFTKEICLKTVRQFI